MPVTLLATSLERKGFSDVTSATDLGEYLAHGIFMAGEFSAHARWVSGNLASVNDLIIFQQDSCLYRTNCTFVPPLNVLVTLKVATPDWNVIFPTRPRIYTLQFNRAEVVQESLVIGLSGHVSTWPAQAWIKMYVDETVPGLTPKDDRLHLNFPQLNHTVHQYLKMSGAFDSDRPFWKDRNTKMDEFLESQRERKHICTLTNQQRVNFTWNNNLAVRYSLNPLTSADLLPSQSNGWTIFRNWKLLDGENLIEYDSGGVQDLVIQETGIYELHFNVFFYAEEFAYSASNRFTFNTREGPDGLDAAIAAYLSTDTVTSGNAANQYGLIHTWNVSAITNFDNLFDGYETLTDIALQEIVAGETHWDISNVNSFIDMFAGLHKYGVDTVLAVNAAWDDNTAWSQTNANLRTAPFETRQQVVDAIDLWNLTGTTYMNTYGNINDWEFESTLTDFSGLFYREPTPLTNFDEDISGWDVLNVTNMSSMFKGCSSFNRDISGWNVSSVTNMSSMFEGCTGFRQNLQDWAGPTPGGSPPPSPSSISNVTSFTDMFKGSGLWDVDLVVAISSNWYLRTGANWPYYNTGSNWSQTAANLVTAPFRTRDQLIAAIDHWNDSSSVATETYGSITAWEFEPILTDFSGLFYRETSPLNTFDEDLSLWDVSNVTTMSSMFEGCASFNSGLSLWDVSTVTLMSSMFKGCSGFNQDINNWGTKISSVTDMSSMFEGCSIFDNNLSSWLVSGVVNMSSMFKDCEVFTGTTGGSIEFWVPSSVTNMSSMFEGCDLLDFPINAWGGIKVGNVVAGGFNDIFKGLTFDIATVIAININWSLSNSNWSQIDAALTAAPIVTRTQLDSAISTYMASPTFTPAIDTWTFSSDLKDMSNLFSGTNFNGDISGWDVSNVEIMTEMFKDCTLFNQSLALWDVGNVTNMESMFENCNSMDVTNQESLKHWNVSSVGVSAVNNSELWSVDYCFSSSNYTTIVSGDDSGDEYDPVGVYETLTNQVGVWNRTTQVGSAMDYAWSSPTQSGTNAKYEINGLDSCLIDDSHPPPALIVVYKAKTNVDFVWNITNADHQCFSPEGHHASTNSGLNRFQKTNVGYEVTSIHSNYFPGPMLGEFRNLPPGTYTMRCFGQTHSNISVPVHNSDDGKTIVPNIGQFSTGGQTASPTATQAYVDFTGLSPGATAYSTSDAIGFQLAPKTGQTVHSMGGVQLKRVFQVSRFLDMFKNSAWTTNAVNQIIDAAWGDTITLNSNTNLVHGNANWWRNEAKLLII